MAVRNQPEAELCSLLVRVATEQGWTCYPETALWDVLLVATDKVQQGYRATSLKITEGMQVGIEAKAKAGIKVLCQVLDRTMIVNPWKKSRSMQRNGPNFVAVLVNEAGKDFRRLTRDHLRINLITRTMLEEGAVFDFRHPLEFEQPEWTPPVVPQMQAGKPSPSPLTRWRVAALKVCNRLDDGELLTRREIKEMGVDPKIWLIKRWVVETGKKRGRSRLLKKGPNDKDYPAVGFELEAQALRDV